MDAGWKVMLLEQVPVTMLTYRKPERWAVINFIMSHYKTEAHLRRAELEGLNWAELEKVLRFTKGMASDMAKYRDTVDKMFLDRAERRMAYIRNILN